MSDSLHPASETITTTAPQEGARTSDSLTIPNSERDPFMARHTTMPPRIQKTPHGDVSLTSRWMRDRYYLVATGPGPALRWLFPTRTGELEAVSPTTSRLAFPPAPMAITIERELRRVCARWQDAWSDRLADHVEGVVAVAATKTAITTLGELFDHYTAERQGQLAASTRSRDRYRLQVWRDELGSDLRLAEITPALIAAALNRIGARTSPVTANTALAVLKTYLTWAANMRVIPDFSHRTVKPLRDPADARKRKEWWTVAEVDLALRCAGQDTHQPTATLLVACGCYLGLRVEEIIMLRWQDLDLEAKDPRDGKPKPVCHITPHGGWQPKDGEARDVPICAELLAVLQQHRQAEGYLLRAEEGRPGRPRGGKGWIYRYDPKKVWARVMKAVVTAGGKAITMYGMRHSFASNLLIAGVSDVKVSRWLGHADTRMVHRHYGHLLSYDADINAISRGRSGLVES